MPKLLPLHSRKRSDTKSKHGSSSLESKRKEDFTTVPESKAHLQQTVDEESEEENMTHLGGREPLSVHFTFGSNVMSEEETE